MNNKENGPNSNFAQNASLIPRESVALARNAIAPLFVAVGYPLAYFAGGTAGEVGAGLAAAGTLVLSQKAIRGTRERLQRRKLQK